MAFRHVIADDGGKLRINLGKSIVTPSTSIVVPNPTILRKGLGQSPTSTPTPESVSIDKISPSLFRTGLGNISSVSDIKSDIQSRLWAYYGLESGTPSPREALSGSVGSYVSGKVGNCANFTGSQSLNGNLRLSTLNEFSVSFWFNPTSNAGFGAPISQGSGGAISLWEMHVFHSDSTNFYGFYFAWDGSNYRSVDWSNFTVNNWWHVIVEFSKPTGVISLFVNNDLKATVNTWDTTKNLVAYNSFRIGATADNVYKFNGKVDEVAVILGNTTQDERDWLYNSGSGNSLN